MGRTGRPTDGPIEQDHKILSRRYNGVIDHYSKMLIYLKCMVPQDTPTTTLIIERHRRSFYQEIRKEMEQDEFPAIEQWNESFVLHTGSPHGVLQSWYKQGYTNYSWEEIRLLLLCWLSCKGLLSERVFDYLAQYWEDIVRLVSKNVQESFRNVVELRQERSNNPHVMAEMRSKLEEDDSLLTYETTCYLVGCLQLLPDLTFV